VTRSRSKTPTILEADVVELGGEPQRPVTERPADTWSPSPPRGAPSTRKGSGDAFDNLANGLASLLIAGTVAAMLEASLAPRPADVPALAQKRRTTRRWRNR